MPFCLISLNILNAGDDNVLPLILLKKDQANERLSVRMLQLQ